MKKLILLEGISVVLALAIMGVLVSTIIGETPTNQHSITVMETELAAIDTFTLTLSANITNETNELYSTNTTIFNTSIISNTLNEVEIEISYGLQDEVVNSSYTTTEIIIITNGTEEVATLEIELTVLDNDADNDNFSSDNDCDESNPLINPNATDIPNNGIDEDCSGADSLYSLMSSINKAEYSLQEKVIITVNAPLGVTAIVELCKPEQGNNIYLYNGNCSEEFNGIFDGSTITVDENNIHGNYSLNVTLIDGNTSNSTEHFYEVENSLSAQIEGDLTINEDENLFLIAAGSGGSSPYKFKWEVSNTVVNDNNKINMSLSKGQHLLELTITDVYENSKTEEYAVVVLELFDLTVQVRKESDNSIIQYADVTIKSVTVETDNQGKAKFRMLANKYNVDVDKSDYHDKSVEVNVDQDKTVEIKLIKKDVSSPKITLLTKTGISTKETSYTIEYKVEEANAVTCSFFMKEDDWFVEDSKTNIAKEDATANIKHGFTMSFDIEETVTYRIECKDSEGNKAESSDQTITYELKNKKPEEIEARADIVESLYNLRDSYAEFSVDKRTAAQLLKLEDKLKEDIRLVERALRDINDVAFRDDLTSEEKADYRLERADEIDSIYKSTISNFNIISENKFVNYPDDETLKILFEKYFAREITKEEFTALKEVQNKLSVSTSTYNLDITYLNEDAKKQTLIGHRLSVEEDIGTQDKLVLFAENFDKAINNLENIGEGYYEVIGEEAIYLTSQLSDEAARNSFVLYLPKKIPSGTKATGNVTINPTSKPVWFGTSILVIIIILFIALRSKKFRILYYHFRKNSNYHKMKILIHDAESSLESHDYDQASLIYREIKLAYDHLSVYEKNKVLEDILVLVDLLNNKYMKEKIKDIREQPKGASTHLNKAKRAYNELRKEMKEIALPEINDAIKLVGNKA